MTEETFNYGFELLEKRYPKEALHKDIKALYLQHFMENLTETEFLESVKHTILHSRFMPTAGELVDHIHGAKEAKALQEWQTILSASRNSHDESPLAYLSDRARVALCAIGGLRVVGLADNYERPRLEKSFVVVYCQCSSKDGKSLPPTSGTADAAQTSENPSPMPLELQQQLEVLRGKFAMNGGGNRPSDSHLEVR